MGIKEYLSVYSFNATGISGAEKLSDFNNSFTGQTFDVISITETWFHDGILDTEILTNLNYELFRKDRNHETSVKKSGGGVMLAIHKSLPAIRRNDLETICELVWVEIPLDKTRKAYVGTIYLSVHNETVLRQVEISINKVTDIAKPNDSILLLGDLNLPDISWKKSLNYEYATVSNRSAISTTSDRVLEILDGNCLRQYNTLSTTEPSRDRSTVNNHILDLVIANELDSVQISTIDNATSSTHKALEISTKLNMQQCGKASERVSYNFKDTDWDNVFCLLSCIYWSDWTSFHTVNDAYAHFYDVIYAVMKDSIPTYKIKVKQFPHWYSKALISLIKAKERTRNFFLRRGRNKSSDLYKSFCNLRKQIKKKQKEDWKINISNVEANIIKNPKRFWSHVKSKKSSNSLPNAMKYHGIVYNSTESIVKVFALFFKSVFIQFDQSHTPHCESRFTSKFVMPQIKYIDVQNILRSLQPSTASGSDNISATFLIKCSHLIAKPLADLFNLSILRGEYPDILKRDNVFPVYKRKGSKNSIDCYRGISLQPIIAKIFEGFVNRALRDHLQPLINANQHGFLKSKSCTTNLASYADFISKCFDNKSQTHSIYTDFQRAFDVVPHKFLLMKMNSQFGIDCNILSWFQSYLSNRFQRVIINGIQSEWYSVTSGVPQGSIIGPTLFLMYINDICDCIKYSEILLFADDCKIFKEIYCYNDCLLLQDDLNRVNEWCRLWHMKLHPDKLYYMNFSLKRANDITHVYNIGEVILKRVFEMKDLGIYFTPNLNFNLHISKIVSKSLQMLGFMKRVTRDFTNPKTLHTLYNSLVRSRLEYCSQIWNPSARVHINKLERVQRKYLRYVSYKTRTMYSEYSYESLCTNFNLKTLQSRRSITDLTFLNKLLNNNIDSPYLTSQVYLHVPQRVFRAKPTFYVHCRLQIQSDGFMPRVLTLANNLSLYDDLIMRQPADFKRFVAGLFI